MNAVSAMIPDHGFRLINRYNIYTKFLKFGVHKSNMKRDRW